MSETTSVSTDTSSTSQADTGSDSSDQIQQAGQEPQAAKPLTQAQKEKFMLTVDGEDFEEEIDFNNKEDLKKRFQLAAAAKKRMGEAVTEKRKAFEIIKAFEQDPESMLARLGPKGREIAEKYLLKQIQDDMLSPEEKEARLTKAELEKYRAKEKEAEENKVKTVAQQKEAHYAQEFQKTIITALDKSGMPKSPALVKQMASIMAKNLQLGLELTPDDLAAEVRSENNKTLKAIIADATGDQLIEMFGPDIAKKIRQSDIRKLQEKQSQVFQRGPSSGSSSGSNRESRGPMTMDEWKEQVNRRVLEK